jgi:hypothetical protein
MIGKASRKDRHRRCHVCRARYEADCRTVATQKVCSAKCRAVWRRRQAKRRRVADLDEHRQAERVRQQNSRDRRRRALGPAPSTTQRVTDPPPQRALSRAEWVVQPAVVMGKLLDSWDEAVRLSRAGLERDLARILGDNAPFLGKAVRDGLPVTHHDAKAT